MHLLRLTIFITTQGLTDVIAVHQPAFAVFTVPDDLDDKTALLPALHIHRRQKKTDFRRHKTFAIVFCPQHQHVSTSLLTGCTGKIRQPPVSINYRFERFFAAGGFIVLFRRQ
ncbi:hypothetical protein D3C81_1825510 [compost metagenome]